MKFLLDIPPYDPCSAGVRVMHYLSALLSSAGCDVSTTHRCFYSPLLSVSGSCEEDRIAVYPDIQPGNPLNAKMVVRYMLFFASAYYRQFGGVKIAASDKVIVYHSIYLKDVAEHYAGKLADQDLITVPSVDDTWLFPEPKRVEAVLYRGKRTQPHEPPVSCVEFPTLEQYPNPLERRQATMQLLRVSKSVYTQDHYSAVEAEALLCGARVFNLTGPGTFQESATKLEECQQHLMRPMIDVCRAREFMNRTLDFFNLK